MSPFEPSPADRDQIRRHGSTVEEVERQLELFRHPPPPVELVRPCTVGDGILRIPEARWPALQDRFREAVSAGRLAKFVPASGAATRMFRRLLAVHRGEAGDEDRAAADRFAAEARRFPFWDDLAAVLRRRGRDPEEIVRQRDLPTLLAALFDPPSNGTDEGADDDEDGGLGYADRPKALIAFHRYAHGGVRSALEEHVVEAAEHLRSADGACIVHFTIPQHQEMEFREVFRAVAGRLEERFGGRFELSCSVQRPSTDTVAVEVTDSDATGDGELELVRDEEGRILFRPGGHGALLHNLGALAEDAGVDLVLVRNIDNVQPEGRRREVLQWNRILGGYLLAMEHKIVDLLGRLQRSENVPTVDVDTGLQFVAEALHHRRALDLLDRPDRVKRAWLIDRLDRPLRVCGMVRNEGEPGGGPFWVRTEDDEGNHFESLQIVETAQIDAADPAQAEILESATHFSPAHLVCRLRSHAGDPYDLDSFVDPRTAFVTRKTHAGRPIRVLERPGLWNGAMARWNTIFVEVPSEVFAPVKTVFDLLRPAHRAAE